MTRRSPTQRAGRLRRALGLSLALGALTACTTPASTTAPATVVTTDGETIDEARGERHRFLALYLDGQQVGGIETTLRPLPDGGLQIHDRFSFEIQRVNPSGGGEADRFSLESRSITEYGPDDALRYEESTQTEAGVVEKHVTRIDGDTLTLQYEGPGQSFEKQFPLPPDFRSSRAVFLELVEKFDAADAPAEAAYASFDSDEQRFVKKTMRVEGRHEVEHGELAVVAYDVVDRSEDGTVVTSQIDRDYLPISLDMFGTFTAQWVDDPPFDLDAIAQITSEIPVEGRVSEWWDLERLDVTIEVKGDDPKLPPLWSTSHYHRVERDGTTYRVQLLTTRPPSLDGTIDRPAKPRDPDVARFLDPTPLSQSDDDEIRATARKVVGDEKNSVLAGVRIVQWVYENLDKRAGVRGSATATEVLAAMAGDCTEHAALTVALARAAGLPARNVDGIVFVGAPDGSMLAGYHAWSEIWVGHWIAVDAVFAEVGTSARYLAFGYNEPGEMGSGASLSRTVGKLSIAIDGYQQFGEKPVKLK
jgi:transglutaminase-like putative cysteine protease